MVKNQTLRWVTGAAECFLFCGFILGWHLYKGSEKSNFFSKIFSTHLKLRHIFEEEGFFCTQALNTTCDEELQSEKLTATFSISVSLMPVSAVIFGVLIG